MMKLYKDKMDNEHNQERNKEGKIDEFATGYEYHNDPQCNRCGYGFCINCTSRN